ncbi:Fe-S cluster assembly protein SufD [Bacteroides propionicifaciens]|uniref:Fe-S cluster assembly protein SufD n=1 Tax=Bacteroides propionicifaciens TaxID=392838 RepID=UPI00037FB0A9|nr:Fe-S cluster assembly protein SufD [Bacteroides propionicifaciens]
MNTATKNFIDLYTREREVIQSNSSEIINGLRTDAMLNFKKLGLPSRKLEKYKYTDVQKYFEGDFLTNFDRKPINYEPSEVFKCEVPNLNTVQAFLLNDSFYPTIDKKELLPKGVTVGSLSQMADRFIEWFAKYYGKIANTREDALVALNTALVQDGVFIYIPKNTVVDVPIQLINILSGDQSTLVNRRLLIMAEENAQVNILMCNHAVSAVDFLQTGVTEIFAGENAHINFYEIEETHSRTHRFNSTFVHQAANSVVQVNTMTLMNGVSCNNTNFHLAGQGAHADCNGMTISDKEQHIDNITLIDHAVPHCTSHELFKYVLDDKAVGAFTGMILVRPDAQHTNSEQTNRSICLTKEARMYARPQLEIYADDVRCGHGATVGQLDEKALFYMQARGINRDEARLLLMFAFVNEVIDKINIDPLKEHLHQLVERRFRGELCNCAGSALNK